MKKIFASIFILLLALVLVSCKKPEKKPDDGGNGDGNKPTTIKIMHGALNEVDPFDPSFSGQNQEERQALQKDVEKRLNVKVQYVAYPTDAGWGPARVDKIIEQHKNKAPMADIYWTTTSWTSQLANEFAIAPVDQWVSTHGKNLDEAVRQIGTYKGQFYSFTSAKPTGQLGLYFNENLLKEKGLENPAEIFKRGEWTWSKFDEWSKKAQAVLSKDGENSEYVLGGAYPMWAQSLVPLNGGNLVNLETGRVGFDSAAAIEAYNEIIKWVGKGYFEPTGTYDAGSPEWQAGRVLMHPGAFWFLNAPNRWGTLNFNLGYVPYPVSDSYKGKYVTPISGEAVYNIANQEDKAKQELAFQVWNELQLWRSNAEGTREFKAVLKSRLREDIYVDAFLEIYEGIYLEILDDLGIPSYGANSWRPTIASTIRGENGVSGDPRSALAAIKPIYQDALDKYLGK
ncbi:ABC transporter substrate-binding protein [Haploplasma modicum]|uniref:ABC transporter substrate-binding protein n=1 Tax=Haploplasma modicum TaxID=2150 RepID=UPI00047AFD4C|nr:extracellular solute-binding protein [Haploplasma modicum]